LPVLCSEVELTAGIYSRAREATRCVKLTSKTFYGDSN
jgi:hypothetical protein